MLGVLVEPRVSCDWTIPHHGLSQEMLSYGHEQEKHKEAPDCNGDENIVRWMKQVDVLRAALKRANASNTRYWARYFSVETIIHVCVTAVNRVKAGIFIQSE
jgi:hypothetical protein